MSDSLLADIEPNQGPSAPLPAVSTVPSRRRPRVALAALLLAAAGYSWLASDFDLSRFAPLVVGVPMVFAAVAALRSWIHHDRRRAASRSCERRRFGGLHHRGVLMWSVLAALLIAWELRELTGSPRVDYPTVTSLVGTITSFRPVYALAFLAWLVVGYRLIERQR
jgi:hypothetical protein